MNDNILLGYRSDSKAVKHILNLLTYNDDCDEPENEFDKLIYNVNLTINEQYNSKKLIEFARKNNFEQVIRIALVLIYNQEIIDDKEKSVINSHTYIKKMFKLKDITEKEKSQIIIIYNDIYNMSSVPNDFESSQSLSIANTIEHPKKSSRSSQSSQSLSIANTIEHPNKSSRSSRSSRSSQSSQ